MMKMSLRTAIVLLCASLLAACKWSWPPWNPPPSPSQKALINSYPIPVHADCVKNDHKVDVVHIVVPDVDPLDLEGSTLAHLKSDDHGNVPQGGAVAPDPTPLPNHKTYADFVAAPYLLRKHDVAMIELELTDKRYTFMPGRNATVITSKAAHGEMFCIKRNMDVRKGARTVAFYVRWVDKADGQPVIGAYNFNVEDGKGHRRFLSVDPEIKNQG